MTGGAIYAQIDDQLWDQMVALPLFGEPGLVANGVQIANVQYNASAEGILWNLPAWTGPQARPTEPIVRRWSGLVGRRARRLGQASAVR